MIKPQRTRGGKLYGGDHFLETKYLISNAIRKTLPSQDGIQVVRKLADLSDMLDLLTFL